MKSCTVPVPYGVERLAPNLMAPTTVWKAAIFQAALAWVAHWLCTSSLCVASYYPAISTPVGCSTSSARVPRIGPDVITGELMRMRFCAEASDLDMACTSFIAHPGQK